MNNLYFACSDCKIYVDAGYRWAYWELEHAGVVSTDMPVNVDAVLRDAKFWNPPEDSRWLYEDVFPPLREFLQAHKDHRIVFGTDEDFAPNDDAYYLTWMQVGYLLKLTPRYLAEVLGLRSWDQGTVYIQSLEHQPTWWQVTWDGPPSSREKGKRAFEALLKHSNGS